jgi:hypothetical protein
MKNDEPTDDGMYYRKSPSHPWVSLAPTVAHGIQGGDLLCIRCTPIAPVQVDCEDGGPYDGTLTAADLSDGDRCDGCGRVWQQVTSRWINYLAPFAVVPVSDAYKNPKCELNGRSVLLLAPCGKSDWYVSLDLTRTAPKCGLYDYDYIVHVSRLQD